MNPECWLRVFLAFGLLLCLYILKDFLTSHRGIRSMQRWAGNGCEGPEVVCNGVQSPKAIMCSRRCVFSRTFCPQHVQTGPDPTGQGAWLPNFRQLQAPGDPFASGSLATCRGSSVIFSSNSQN